MEMVCVFFVFQWAKRIRRINSQPKLQISDEEIDHVYRTFAKSHRQKLMGYYQLKSMLGPLIEGLILLDRLQWLAEKQVLMNKLQNLCSLKLQKACMPLISFPCCCLKKKTCIIVEICHSIQDPEVIPTEEKIKIHGFS